MVRELYFVDAVAEVCGGDPHAGTHWALIGACSCSSGLVMAALRVGLIIRK